MNVVIDLDLHEAIQSFTNRAPAGVYDCKSQDTIDFQIYFVKSGVVQDLGAGMALKFGLIATGDTTDTILAYQTTFSYQTDSSGNIYYLGQVVFNTAQMATAITGKTQLPCTAEIRYQTSDNEIIHSLNISFLVFPTILVETGVTPPNVSTGYPDASTIELLVHKNVASGYAGLDAQGDITGSVIPVDNQTIVVNSAGDIAAASILAITAANFTTPAANATVSVTFVSTSSLVAGQYVRIPIAGYYIVESITSGTVAVLQNNGDPFNAASGTTITSGAVLLPAQAAAGGGGTPGQNAYTQTTASFVVPAVGATVSITVGSTAWLGGAGYWVFITGAGYYAVNSITDTTHVVLTNGGSASNATPGSTVPSGATVSAAGPAGATGASGQGLAAYDALTATFTMPNAGANVTIAIGSTAWVGVGQVLYIATAGYMSVIAISSATQLNIQNLNYPGNAASGTSIASGSHVGPAGPIGPQGAGGAGLNAYTTLAANFTQPAVGSSVNANVVNSSWVPVSQILFVQGGGWYQVSTVPDLTHITLINLGYAGNAAPGATITSGTTVLVSPSGPQGSAINAFTTTTASFVMPAVNASVTVSVGSTAWLAQGQNLYLPVAGYMSVAVINSSTSVALTNLGSPANAASGTTIANGTSVVAGGAQGQQGPAGATGPSGGISDAPSDGNLYGRKNAAWNVVPAGGGGGPFDPATGFWLYEDFAQATAPPPPNWGWISATGAVNPAYSLYGQDATRLCLGCCELSTGTGTDNAHGVGAHLYYAGAIGGTGPWHGITPGYGIMTCKFRVAINQTIPSGQAVRIVAGLAAMSGTPYNNFVLNYSMLFDYEPDVTTFWRMCKGIAGTATYTNTATAPSIDTPQWLTIVTDAAWATWTFSISGIGQIGQLTGVGVIGASLSPVVGIVSNRSVAGSAYLMEVDACSINYQFTR